jgi:hypothetical protein
MNTVTRTFPISLTSNYTSDSIIELCHFRDMVFDADERVGVYLESFFCNLNLKSFNLGVIPNFDGDESEAEKMAKFSAAELKSQKVGLRILIRKNNTGDWLEKAEIILINRGRKDYFDLLQPYLAKNQVRIFEKNDALAIQLIDYGNGLLKPLDSLGIEAAFTVTIAKKNDVEELENRLAALELAINGRLTNINPNHFLGREINQGVVTQIPFSRFATQGQIDQAIIDLVGGAPGALNTLIELANALNNDANFGSNVINSLATKAPQSNPSFTGLITTAGQIAFPAVQNPSTSPNILDDYEEGTWTPVLTYTSPGNSSITHGWNTGRYQKIGNRVFITIDVRISAFTKGNASGFLCVTGLPFPARAGGGYNNSYGFLAVGNAPYTGIPFLDTGSGISGSGNIIFLFKSVPNLVNQPLEDPVAGALYWGQINYEVS